jgi:biopolymer transport protein ExbD
MARKPQENPQLDMTPMIDVVFELIIFFVVTIKQEDIFSKLNCNRPAPATGQATEKDDITVNIEIGRRYDGSPQGVILYNKREVRRTELDAALRDIARTSTKTPVIVKCTGDSPHKALVDVLDICYHNNLFSVSVFSLDN